MLPGGSDPFYREILAASHQTYDRIEVWDGTKRLAVLETAPTDDEELLDSITDQRPIVLAGSGLNASLMSPVARQVTLRMPWYLYPWDDDDLLAPMGNELRVWSGVRLATGALDYVWQVFRGKIQDVPGSSAGGYFTVSASDPAQEVIDNEFVTPQNSPVGATVTVAAQQLIADAYPSAEFGPSDAIPALVPALSWEFSRSAAIEEMMRANGALWYPLADGRFVFRRYPWAQAGAPVVAYRDGPGGTVASFNPSRSRSQVYNVIGATSERLNGDAPVFGLAQDNDPTSPTYVGGKFGRRTQLMRLQTPTTQGGIDSAANARLRSAITPTMACTWVMTRDAALELGDVAQVDVTEFDRQFTQVVTGFGYQFGEGSMNVTARAQVVGEVEAS